MTLIADYLKDFTALFYPEICNACGTVLYKNEQLICTGCLFKLPKTDYHLNAENRLVMQFWGRFKFETAAAFLYFRKGGSVQNMMHQLKYNNTPELAHKLGALYGNQLVKQPDYALCDVIIPVPLHTSRLKKRGYNQSEKFADGLAEKLNIPVLNNVLIKKRASESQTTKSRFSRFENLKETFILTTQEEIVGKRILLVDDTITTGATLEACANVLNEVENIKLVIAGMAYTE